MVPVCEVHMRECVLQSGGHGSRAEQCVSSEKRAAAGTRERKQRVLGQHCTGASSQNEWPAGVSNRWAGALHDSRSVQRHAAPQLVYRWMGCGQGGWQGTQQTCIRRTGSSGKLCCLRQKRNSDCIAAGPRPSVHPKRTWILKCALIRENTRHLRSCSRATVGRSQYMPD